MSSTTCIYICGPTVYDVSHLGHARTYITADIYRRFLEDYLGMSILYAMNITDVDDKIIKRASEKSISPKELAETYEREFFCEMDKLNVRYPDVVARATEYIDKMIEFIEKIIQAEMAYEQDGSVYLDMQRYISSEYASIEEKKKFELTTSHEQKTTEKEHHKKHSADFALWKAAKPGEVKWESPWGEGRPGWHIECSAMATNIFKDVSGGIVDVHIGGIDLAFPHHMNEDIQSKIYLGTNKWVKEFWHVGHLHIDGCKMSKSEKNFITINEVLQTYSANVVRMMFMMHKIHTPMDYNTSALENAKAQYHRFDNLFTAVKNLRYGKDRMKVKYKTNLKLLNDIYTFDIDIGGSTGDFVLMIDELNRFAGNIFMHIESCGDDIDIVSIRKLSEKMYKLLVTLGFTFDTTTTGSEQHVDVILSIRNEVRELAMGVVGKENKVIKGKLFGLSDKIRDVHLLSLGHKIQDK